MLFVMPAKHWILAMLWETNLLKESLYIHTASVADAP
jgi:hypothetical protein